MAGEVRRTPARPRSGGKRDAEDVSWSRPHVSAVVAVLAGSARVGEPGIKGHGDSREDAKTPCPGASI